MASYYVKQPGADAPNSGTHRGYWATSTTYAVGDRVFARQVYGTSTARRYCFECTTGGTTHATTEPTWNTTVGGTTTSGTAVFTTRAPTGWTNAHISANCLQNANNYVTGGDTVYLDSTLNDTLTSALGVSINGTSFGEIKWLSVDATSGEPPTTLQAGAKLTGGSSAVTYVYGFPSGNVYVYGVTFSSSTNNSYGYVNLSGSLSALYENCTFELLATGNGNAQLVLNTAYNSIFTDCAIKFTNVNHRLAGSGLFEGCNWNTSTAAPTGLCTMTSNGIMRLVGCDLSSFSSTAYITTTTGNNFTAELVDCKMPASWGGTLIGNTNHSFINDIKVVNCDNADTNYKFSKATTVGTQVVETTLVRDGGASDGTTPISWKVVTNSNGTSFAKPYIVEPILYWNDAVGSSKTLTIELLHDSATGLKNNEIWADVAVLTTSGYPLASHESSGADAISSGTTLTSSSATWTTTGMTNPNAQKMTVTFTPQEVGFIIVKVYVKVNSKTLYICPKVAVA